MSCHDYLSKVCRHMDQPNNCKYAHRASTQTDAERMSYCLMLNRMGVGKGKGSGKGGKGIKNCGSSYFAPPAKKTPALPTFKLCTHYPKGTCSFGKECKQVHQNNDGRTV